MPDILSEILDQPRALRQLLDFYQEEKRLPVLEANSFLIISGMGASFHAGAIAVQHLHSMGQPALAIEGTDLINYAFPLIQKASPLVYISQSGTSGEISPIINALPQSTELIAITNYTDSTLAKAAKVVLPLYSAGEEFIASKSYVNTLALLWLTCRNRIGVLNDSDFHTLYQVADQLESLLNNSQSVTNLLESIETAKQIIFLGHGPHAITARQSAMILGEWTKTPAMYASVGSFRHGPMEIVQPGTLVIFFATGKESRSSFSLAEELSQCGAACVMIYNGQTFPFGTEPIKTQEPDEFLSPILDVAPVQLLLVALAEKRKIPPGFRYIQKVVTNL